MLHRLPWATNPITNTLPPLGPDLLDEAVSLLGGAGGVPDRADLQAYLQERLPAKISASSRDRFARYLARPYVVDGQPDTAAFHLLASSIAEGSKYQVALAQLAWTEPILAAFLEECLPDPGWRRFTVRGLGNWVSHRRGREDRTTVYRLIGALKRAGFLRPFDRAWLLTPPRPSAAALLLGILRELPAPGRTTLSAIFSCASVRRASPRAESLFALLGWASDHDLLRWRGPGDATIWIPRDRVGTITHLVANALPEPTLP